jgi:hypothetical protein
MRPCLLVFLLVPCLTAGACGRASKTDERVQASYDKASGKLNQLTVDASKDGKPNIVSHMDGRKFVRIEIDKDEDGKVDRWEYYGADQKITRIGMSRANDGKADAWMFPAPDGTIGRIEVSTRHDGEANRVEFYEKGKLARAEEDTNRDGRVDKWETYADGALTTVAFDTKRTGTPDTIVDYRKDAGSKK